MIRIRSYSAGGEEAEIPRLVQDCCATLGLESTLQEAQSGRFNVISRWRGAGGGTSLMLNGHLDTNPAGEGWTRDPLGGDVDDAFIYMEPFVDLFTAARVYARTIVEVCS
jgi:acetylornithine deacetylase